MSLSTDTKGSQLNTFNPVFMEMGLINLLGAFLPSIFFVLAPVIARKFLPGTDYSKSKLILYVFLIHGLFMFGRFIATLFAGYCTDKRPELRKGILCFSLIIMAALTGVSNFGTDLQTILVIQALRGIADTFNYILSNTIGMDYTHRRAVFAGSKSTEDSKANPQKHTSEIDLDSGSEENPKADTTEVDLDSESEENPKADTTEVDLDSGSEENPKTDTTEVDLDSESEENPKADTTEVDLDSKSSDSSSNSDLSEQKAEPNKIEKRYEKERSRFLIIMESFDTVGRFLGFLAGGLLYTYGKKR